MEPRKRIWPPDQKGPSWAWQSTCGHRDAGILQGGVLNILTHRKAWFACQGAERLAHDMAVGESKQASGPPSSRPGLPVAWVPHTFHFRSGECRAQKCPTLVIALN